MKKLLLLVFLTLFVLTGCGERGTEDVCVVAHAGDAWYVGFGQAEIALPADTKEPLYLAGYHSGAEHEGVRDLQCVSAVWMGTEPSRGMLLISVDCVGLGSDTVAKIRAAAEDAIGECEAVIVWSTHTHAGIDTLGLWGPVAMDGKNTAFGENLLHAAGAAARAAYESRTPGTVCYGTAEATGMQYDSREPRMYDDTLYQLRFVPDDSAERGTRIVFFAAHAEALRGDNRLVSRDFPGEMAEYIRAKTGDEMLFVPGAIGGLIMTPIVLDPAEEAENPDFYSENCRKTGELLAEYAISITDERTLSPTYRYASRAFSVPLDNTVFLYYKFLGIIGNPVTGDGTVGETGYALSTTCGALSLGGCVTVALIPGEIFPELVYADTPFLRAGAGYTLTEETFPTLSALAAEYGVKDLLIAGLCNDEIGYILPPGDYRINPDLPYFDGIEDENGENHYEETNSAGIRCAQSLADAMRDVFAALD